MSEVDWFDIFLRQERKNRGNIVTFGGEEKTLKKCSLQKINNYTQTFHCRPKINVKASNMFHLSYRFHLFLGFVRSHILEVNGVFSSLLLLKSFFSERNQLSKESVQPKTRTSTELVPLWKVYGFSRSGDGCGGVAKDSNEFQQQMKQKNMFCIYTNHMSPLQWPSSSKTTTTATAKVDNHQAKKTAPAQQLSWNKRLMHRTRSAMM